MFVVVVKVCEVLHQELQISHTFHMVDL